MLFYIGVSRLSVLKKTDLFGFKPKKKKKKREKTVRKLNNPKPRIVFKTNKEVLNRVLILFMIRYDILFVF
jgi:hypothetical protein